MPTHGERITAIECQQDRLCSDYESEKRNHADIHREMNAHINSIDTRVRKIERWAAVFAGAALLLNAIGTVVTIVVSLRGAH